MPEWYVEGDTQARVRERKGARLRALCVVSRWWESGKSVFHFERLKVQTSIYSASQIILSSRTQERWNVNRLFFSPNREPVHKLWNVPLRSFNLDSILCLLRQNSFNTIDTVSDRFFFFQGSTETLFTWNDMNEVSHLCKFSLALQITRLKFVYFNLWS